MKKLLLLPFLIIRKIVNLISGIIDNTHNRIQITRNNIQYNSFPIINGRIQFRNKGKVIIGKNVMFNCSVYSNMMGLYKTCTIAVDPGAELFIDDFSGFSGVSIYCTKSIKIGKHVNCGGNVAIWDTDFHPLDIEDRRIHDVSKIQSKQIIIEDDVFIGANSIVLKGTQIGFGSIIGAGSVVSKNVPPKEIWAGNPIRFIRKL